MNHAHALAADDAIDGLIGALTRPQKRPISDTELLLLSQATPHTIPYHSHALKGYSWQNDSGVFCDQPPRLRVLLVHGWESRASQWQAFIPSLLAANYAIYAFDAPAHGDSTGAHTDVISMGEAVVSAACHFGDIDAVIGHSLGSAASLYAFPKLPTLRASVHMCGPSSLVRALQRAARFARLSADAASAFRTRYEEVVGLPAETMDLDRLKDGFRHPALVLHDPEDKEVPYGESVALASAWSRAQLESIGGVGHRRIMKDEKTIARVITFLDRHATERKNTG